MAKKVSALNFFISFTFYLSVLFILFIIAIFAS